MTRNTPTPKEGDIKHERKFAWSWTRLEGDVEIRFEHYYIEYKFVRKRRMIFTGLVYTTPPFDIGDWDELRKIKNIP